MCLAKGVDLMVRLRALTVRHIRPVVLAFAGAFIYSAEPVAAQTGICADTASTESRGYKNIYASLVSKTDTASARRRSQLQLPLLQAIQVRLVADTTVCRTASNAFDTVRGVSLPTTSVIVLELGSAHRVVVKDIGFTHYWLNFLFNSDFSQHIKRIWL
jgi:hypothetical protein